MGHLFYVEGISRLNPDPCVSTPREVGDSAVREDPYWSGTSYDFCAGPCAWIFIFQNGIQDLYLQLAVGYVDLGLSFGVVPDEGNALVPGFPILEFLQSVGTHIAIENVDLCLWIGVLKLDSIANGLSAADSAAIHVSLFP